MNRPSWSLVIILLCLVEISDIAGLVAWRNEHRRYLAAVADHVADLNSAGNAVMDAVHRALACREKLDRCKALP